MHSRMALFTSSLPLRRTFSGLTRPLTPILTSLSNPSTISRTSRFTSQRLFQRNFATQQPQKSDSSKLLSNLVAAQNTATKSASTKSSSSSSSRSNASKGTFYQKNRSAILGLGFGALVTALGAGFYFLGRPESGEEDEFSDENELMAYFLRAQKRVDDFIKFYTEPSSELLLPPPLPPQYQRPYTLVIDLDETLVHSTWSKGTGWRTVKRPGLDYFLAYMSEFFEIVIFTQQTVMYADPILNKIDPQGYIMYKLYRDSTKYENGKHYKDLSKLNREIGKVLLLEDDPNTYQQENVIHIKPWKGDPNDRELLALLPFLETLAVSGVNDVRGVLRNYEGKHIPTVFAENQKRFKEKMAPEQAKKGFWRSSQPSVDIQEKQAQQHQEFLKHLQQQQQQQQTPPPQSPQPQSPPPEQSEEKSGGIWGWFQKK